MLEWITDRLFSFFEQAACMAKDRREVQDNALRSVSHALNETYLYYRDLVPGSRDRERERQLRHLWAAAAIPVRHLDEDLAMTCEYKAEYWVNPENWSQDEIRTHRIQLEAVRARYRSLLSRSAFSVNPRPSAAE